MAERSVNDLSYGHFGELYYDNQIQQWLSKRHQSYGAGLQALGRARTYVEPEILYEDAPVKSKVYPGQLADDASHALSSTIPEFGLAPATLDNHTSDWTETAAKRSEEDWKFGDLLALAKLHTEHTSGHRIKECNVLAFPSGGAGDILKLTELRDAREGWGVDRKSAWLKTFEVRETDSSTYIADGKIRQICFARNQVDESHPLLAVRTAMSITVFLPQIYLSAESADKINRVNSGNGSRIALQQVNKFSIEGNGLIEFVDIAFNPWFPTLLAAVLEDGRYHLWTLLPGQHTWDQKDSIEGDIGDPEVEDTETDNWHKIVWMSNSTFIVSTRTHLKAFRRRGAKVVCINQDVLATNGVNIILDVRRSPVDDSCIFVTNTTHIMCLSSTRNVRNVDADPSFTIALSWRHYRDPNDFSLKVSFIEEEAGLKIVLLSRATALTTVYDLTFTTHEHPLQVTAFDSYCTNVISKDISNEQGHTSDLLILPSELRGRLTLPGAGDLDDDSWLAKCMSLGYGFYQALMLHADLSIDAQLAYAQLTSLENQSAKSAAPELFIPAPIWNMVRSRHKMMDKTRVLADDTFIDDDDTTISLPKRQARFRRIKRQGARHTLADLDENPNLVISLRLAYDELIVLDKDMNDSLQIVINRTHECLASMLPDLVLGSLATFCTAIEPPVDLDNSMDLGTLIRQVLLNADDNMESRLSIAPLGLSDLLGTGAASEQVSLVDHKHNLYTLFVQPLLQQLVTATTDAQTELLNRIAWRTALAGLGVCRIQEVDSTVNSQSSEPMPSQPSSQITSASQVNTQATTAETEDGEAALSAAQRTQAISSAISRLSLLTRLQMPETSQSKNETLILDHWLEGGDPAAYDYEEKTAALAGTINLKGSAMTAEVSQQVKRKKKKEQARNVKRRKIEERVAENSQRSSQSMALPNPSSQQPIGNRRLRSNAASQAEPMSSQALESQLTTASQPVSGAYGSRPSMNRRSLGGLGARRGRRAGF